MFFSNILKLYTDFFLQVYEYREFIKQSVTRDLKNRYKRSALGYLWSMISPLALMIILTIVFSNIMRGNIDNYSVFLFAGMLPWAFFESSCIGSLGIIRGNMPIIEKTNMPKYIFIVSLCVSNLVNFLLSLVPLIIVMLFTGQTVGISILSLPLFLIPLVFIAIGVSCVTSIANIFFDDTQHLVQIGMRAMYFLSPILYSRDLLPQWLIPKITILNPMFVVIEQIRHIFYEASMPQSDVFVYSLIISILVLGAGLLAVRRTNNKVIYFV